MSATSRLERLDERSADSGVNTRRHVTRVPLYNSFDDDGFDFRDARTNGTTALKLAPRLIVSDSANAEQLAYAKSAGERLQAAIGKRRQPKVEPEWYALVRDYTPTPADAACFGGVAALLKAAPPERTLTSIQYSMTARTVDDHEAYLRGCEQRALANRALTTKTARKAA